MKKQFCIMVSKPLFPIFICLLMMTGCVGSAPITEPVNIKILASWQGDCPVDQLLLFPKGLRETPVGFIDNTQLFEGLFKVLKPGEDVPAIDFKTSLVLFARNTEFYNRNSIMNVSLQKGLATILVMETMSAIPIQDKVAMSLVEISRKGITGIANGDEVIPLP